MCPYCFPVWRGLRFGEKLSPPASSHSRMQQMQRKVPGSRQEPALVRSWSGCYADENICNQVMGIQADLQTLRKKQPCSKTHNRWKHYSDWKCKIVKRFGKDWCCRGLLLFWNWRNWYKWFGGRVGSAEYTFHRWIMDRWPTRSTYFCPTLQ